MTFTCPDCEAPHEPEQCARDAAMCDCCAAIFLSQEARTTALEAAG